MSFISADILEIIGWVYAIAGIVFMIPIVFFFKQYFRFLDHAQFLFLFYVSILSSGSAIFSKYLFLSWADISANIYVFCSSGDLVCALGFQLSFTSCFVAFILLVGLIVIIVKCKKPEAKYEPIYRFLKGLFRWTYVPLVYYSLYYLITSITNSQNYLVESIVIFAVCTLFPICQLIGYKILQK